MRKILFVELLGGIGDVLIALPAIQALSRCYPDAEITVLTLAPGGELLANDPLIHRIVYADRNRSKCVEMLLSSSWDLVVSDTNYDGIEQVIKDSSVARSLTNLWRSPPPDQLVGDRFLEVLLAEKLISPDSIKPAQLHITPAEQHRAQTALGSLGRPLVFLCPDAGMAIKRWSEVNFITLGKSLISECGANVVVVEGSDRKAAFVAHQIGDRAQILPRGTLRNLAATLAYADLMIAPDTGPARIAAALNVPTITLFGPAWHGRYGQPSPHINLQGYPQCPERNISNFTQQRCWYGGVCPLDKDWQTCLEAISPAEVLAAAKQFLPLQQFLYEL